MGFLSHYTMDYINLVHDRLKCKLIEPYQPEGCLWMIKRELGSIEIDGESVPPGGILADEVGLGKTVQVLSLLVANPKKKTLIIVPKSIVTQWKSQIMLFMKQYSLFVCDSSKECLDLSKDGIYLVSQSMINHKNATIGETNLHGIHWDRIIIDEAHSLRNKKSKFYESCSLLQSDIKWAITATPVMNRMSDFVNIMNWIGVSQYLCQARKSTIASHCVLRRTKVDIQKRDATLDMKKCHIEVKYIPFAKVEELKFFLGVYHQERKQLLEKKKNISDLLEHLLRMRQLCVHPQLYLDGMSRKTKSDFGKWSASDVTKMQELLKCVQKQPKEDKTLVFCQFVQEIDIYMKFMKRFGYNSVRMDGTMSTKERDIVLQKFNTDPDCHLFFIQINTGGQGINLQTANHVYIMSPNWNPAVEYQAIGRAFRTGQQKDVFVTKFCISSGNEKIPFVEENIIKLQERKKQVISDILNDDRIVNDGVVHKDLVLNREEILKLFNIYNEKE